MIFPSRIRDLPPFEGPIEARRLIADGCDVLFATYPAGHLVLTMEGRTTRHRTGEWYEVPAGVTHSARFAVDTAEVEFWFRR